MQLTVNTCRAPEAREDCRRNAGACLAVLQRYGIAGITSARQEWWTDRETFALLLRDRETGEHMGGVRLQRWGSGVPLPIECALEGIDGRARAWVAGFAGRGVGELCGLWRSPRLRGFGVGSRLTSMGIALAAQARTNTLLGVCDTRNLTVNLRLGFQRDLTLASEGTFEYPNPGLRAHILRVDGACDGLSGASLEDRSYIGHYRDEPVGTETLSVDERRLVIVRDLTLMGES